MKNTTQIICCCLFFLTAIHSLTLRGQAAVGDIRSAVTSGGWNTLASWEKCTVAGSPGTWAAATAIPSSTDGVITILNGHTITCDVSKTVDQVVVASGGKLILSTSTITLADGSGDDLQVSGTFQRTGGTSNFLTINSGATIRFLIGGVYQHSQTGSGVIIPATWDDGSTCSIEGITTGTTLTNLNQSYSNFTWSNSGQTSSFVMEANAPTIRGLFKVTATNSGNLVLGNTATARTWNTVKDMEITGGNFYLKGASATGVMTLELSGYFKQTNGVFHLNRVNSSSNIPILKVGGNFECSAGTFSNNGNASATSSVFFTKIGTQTFTLGGTISDGIEFTVNNGSTLEFATASTVLSNASTLCKFTLASGGGLIIKHAQGISTTAATGCVRIGAPTPANYSFSTSGNYTFNGSASQVPGNVFPTSVNNLAIDNSGGVSISSLASGLTVNGNLTLNSGLLTLGGNNLTLAGTLNGNTPSPTNMVVATSTGEFRKNYSGTGSFLFPIGDNTGTAEYSPVTLNFTAGTFSSAYAGVRVDNSKQTNNSSTTDFLSRFWTVTTSGITSPTCIATFVYADGDVNGTESNIYGGVKNSSVWVCMDGVTTSTNTISKSITNFYDGVFTGGEAAVMNCSACVNPTNAGSIGNAQTGNCGSFDPTAITSTALPTGHTGTLEYKWQSSTTSASSGFSDIASTNSTTYDPSSISQTTWYKRLARVDCRADWTGAAESNVIEMTVSCVNPSSGGTIGIAQSNCGSFDPANITSTAGASGTSCTLEYKWQSSTTSASSGFSDIASSNSTTYDPTTISQTTWFKRLARATCKADWTGAAESNVIQMSVDVAPAITSQPTSPSAVCAGAGVRTFTVAATGSGTLTYQWQEFITAWNDVSNAGVYSGATTVTLTITNPTAGMNANKYRCVVSGTCSPTATTDDNATLTVNDVPAKATSPSPLDGATAVSLDPDLTWLDGGGATSYDVNFGTSSPGSFIGNQGGTTYTPSTLTTSTIYYWRINPKNACGTTTGDVWTFTSEPVTFNPGFENNVSTASGWVKETASDITTTVGTLPSNPVISVLTGNRRLNINLTSTTERYVQHLGYPVSVPASGTNYVHVLAWVRSADNADQTRISAVSTDGGTTVSGTLTNTTASTWVRFTASGTATNGKTYVPRIAFKGNNSPDAYALEDVIIYTTTLSSGVDVTAPNAATGICVNTVGSNNNITWTDGTDNATQTSGISGVLLLRAPAGTSLPTLNPQAYYATDSKIGPNNIGGWTVLSNSIAAGAQSFTDNGAAGKPVIYAIYMRDRAYNYSAAASFTTAYAGPDQTLACAATTATMAATAAPSGYTGTWSRIYTTSGNPAITSPNVATTGITGIASNSVFQWSVSNGSGCTTYDWVKLNIYIGTDGDPKNDTVYNQTGSASFGVSPTFTTGASCQWQVSTNNGSTWSNVSNGGVYSGATDTILILNNPTYSMNGYLYKCVLTATCGSRESGTARLAVLPLTIFSNTTTQACGTDYGTAFGTFTRNISVSGIPATLGTSSGQYVLRQIDVKLGSASCKKNLSTYDFRLTAPDGTNLDFITDLTTQTSNMWVDLHFRDQAALEKISEYASSVQTNYFPFSIGYYAVQTDNSFQSSFNGKNPNGTWVFSIKESAASGTEISFESVQLHFGPAFVNSNVIITDANNECGNASCLDTKNKLIASNNSYAQNDANYPGNTVGGACNWNGANNNSAWFYFIASATSAYISLSGNTNLTSGSADTQPIVVTQSGNCTGTFTVPTGGCPDDESVNNMSYLSANGGGVVTSGNVYVNGIGANTEFNLSGLTIGQRYYLIVDGNGGVSSTFYVEGLNGCAECNTPLPVKLISFEANDVNNQYIQLNWATSSEIDNWGFEVERSTDGINFQKIGYKEGNGNSSMRHNYSYDDSDCKLGIVYYYRLKQIDFDGKWEYSNITNASLNEDFNKNTLLFPNPANDFTNLSLQSPVDEITQIKLYNTMGQIVFTSPIQVKKGINNLPLNLSSLSTGIYTLKIEILNSSQQLRLNKL